MSTHIIKKKKNICAVTIPIYKTEMSEYEEISYRQCLTMFRKYPIYLITFKELNIEKYDNIAKEYDIKLNKKYFDSSFFKDIHGYNSLMKNAEFYSGFKLYEYILIYQLDAFVFRDELEYWCNQGYDYIGAPWFDHYADKNVNNDLWAVGNGGLSLRKVSFFLKVLNWKLPLKKITITKWFSLQEIKKIMYILGWRNNIKYYLRERDKMNEDAFFTVFLTDTWVSPNLPTPEKALEFSFEKSPSYLFKRNGDKLPFGCHAFLKYEYETFWKYYIKKMPRERSVTPLPTTN